MFAMFTGCAESGNTGRISRPIFCYFHVYSTKNWDSSLVSSKARITHVLPHIAVFIQLKTGTAAWFLQTTNYARPTTYCGVVNSFAYRSSLC